MDGYKSTAPCDDCWARVPVPEDWPVDYAYCPKCHDGPGWPVLSDADAEWFRQDQAR